MSCCLSLYLWCVCVFECRFSSSNTNYTRRTVRRNLRLLHTECSHNRNRKLSSSISTRTDELSTLTRTREQSKPSMCCKRVFQSVLCPRLRNELTGLARVCPLKESSETLKKLCGVDHGRDEYDCCFVFVLKKMCTLEHERNQLEISSVYL